MYPRVKVRQQDQDGPFTLQDDTNSPLMDVFGSPSPYTLDIPVKDSENDSPPVVARIADSCVPKLDVPSIPASKGPQKNSKHTREDIKTNVRASFVPRPRAVVSSPDNDEMIGNRTKLTGRRAFVMKKDTLERAKVFVSGTVESKSLLKSMRIGTREGFENKNSLEQRNSLEPTVLRQKASSKKGEQERKHFPNQQGKH